MDLPLPLGVVHRGSLHVAAITLFRMSTLEDWTDIMYINMYGCHEYGYADIPMMRGMCNNSVVQVPPPFPARPAPPA